MRNLGCLMIFLVGCGGAGNGQPIELKNALMSADGAGGVATTLHRTLPSVGVVWHQFYFDCMPASGCQLDLEVRLADATLQKRLTDTLVAEPTRATFKTSQMLLYTVERTVDLHFDQGVLRDFATGDVRMVDNVNLVNQPGGTRYHVGVGFPDVLADAEAFKLIPDDVDVVVRASWR
jgi:hypothetical protein